MEGAVSQAPHESLVLNLATMYELVSSNITASKVGARDLHFYARREIFSKFTLLFTKKYYTNKRRIKTNIIPPQGGVAAPDCGAGRRLLPCAGAQAVNFSEKKENFFEKTFFFNVFL